MDNNTNRIGRFFRNAKSALIEYAHLAVDYLRGRTDNIKSTTTTSIQLVPSVVKKPSVLWRWVFTSYWFYFSVIFFIIVMNTVVNAAIDRSLAAIYPPIKTEKLFGLVVQEQNDPRIAWQRKVIRGVLWAGTVGLNGYVLLLCLPRTVRKAGRKACDKEAMADTLVTQKPSESILLYSKALRLAVDQSHVSSLINKIDMLDNGFRSGEIARPSSESPLETGSDGTGTIAIPKNERPSLSNQEGIIGPDGRYRIERKLGQGAMGSVYLGKDQLLFRGVALKLLNSGLHHDKNLLQRFQQEARALARLSHPNIVQIYDFIKEDTQYWIAMEYVEGSDLESLFNQNGTFEVADALTICSLISDAMDYAHVRGVVHRDFKPSNVLITNAGDPKVMDFGLAKLTQSSIATVEGSLLGSPAYMSPEQAMGKPADERSDIYALGVTLYQLLTGRLPFEGDLKSVITQKIAEHRPSLTFMDHHMPDDLKKLVGSMMAYEPCERPASMHEVGKRLKGITDAVS